MIAQVTWIIGSLIFLGLGTMHLIYTFFSNKFSSRNKELIADMKSSSPILTRETTMWKAWIGFNASHSSGAMFLGIMNVFVALVFFDLVLVHPFYLGLNFVTVGFYLWLARRYWFTIPFYGILLTMVCYAATVAFILI